MLSQGHHTNSSFHLVHDHTHDVMPADLVAQSTKAVCDTFGKICGAEISVHESMLGAPERNKIVGIISFVGDLMLTLALILPHDSSEELAKKFAGFEIDFDCADMGDVVGELINVLAGVLSGNLETVGYSTQMSLPTVARGDAFELMLPDNLVSKRFYFSAEGVDFWIDITAMRSN